MTTTGWVLLWVLLVVGALVVFTLIALHLYKKAKALVAQAASTAEVFDAFARAVEEAETSEYAPVHAFAGGVAQKEEWRLVRRMNRIKRAKRKAARRHVTLERWRGLTIPQSMD